MKELITKLTCIVSAMLLVNFAIAQTTTTVQGRITSDNNKPVINVTIAEVDEDGRTIRAVKSDVEGNFVIRISDTKNKLSITHISHLGQVLSINTRTTFNIKLENNRKDLGDVVVVSLKKADNGMLQIAEKDVTTAQSHISAKDLEEMQAASIDQALQGRLPGIDITANSGDPGAGMSSK